MPNFIALEIYSISGTKSSWNEVFNTCFNVECVLLGRNFDFLGSFLVVTARYLMVTGGYCSLLVVTARCRSLLLVPTLIINDLTGKILVSAVIWNDQIAYYICILFVTFFF